MLQRATRRPHLGQLDAECALHQNEEPSAALSMSVHVCPLLVNDVNVSQVLAIC